MIAPPVAPDDDLVEDKFLAAGVGYPAAPHSYSRLSALLRCPREFYGHYVLKLPSPPSSFNPFETGSRVHDGIEAGALHVLKTGDPSSFLQVAWGRAVEDLAGRRSNMVASRVGEHLTNLQLWLQQNQVWQRWGWGRVDVELPLAVRPDGTFSAWDGDLKAKPPDAEMCFILDLVVRFPTGHALIVDWKTGIVRRKVVAGGVIDPQLLLYAYALCLVDHSIHTVDVTFFNTGWDVPEPAVRLTREQAIAWGRQWLDGAFAELHKRRPEVPDDWAASANKFCFFCRFNNDCPVAFAKSFEAAREALAVA